MSSALPLVWPVTCHTDYVGSGSTFVVIRGAREDGIRYVPTALERGASTIIIDVERDIDPALCQKIAQAGARLIRVPDVRRALAEYAAQAWGNPAHELTIIGVTGTKGKTTTVYLIEHLLRSAGYTTALISTVKNKICDTWYDAPLTTPQADYLHTFLQVCRAQGVTHVVMEIAAQALTLQRVHDIPLSVALFTNFAQEHGEFYATREDYFNAKAQIVSLLKNDAPILLYAGDAEVMKLHTTRRPVYLFGNDSLCASSVTECVCENGALKMTLQLGAMRYEHVRVQGLLGEYNALNAAGAALAAVVLGIPSQRVIEALAHFKGVPGRLECYELSRNRRVYIDYAHNPSSFAAVLSTLRSMTNDLRVVFGCGGLRDREKRPVMGYVASMYANTVYITTDNPRTEQPAQIAEQILAGVPDDLRHHVHIVLDRAAAIEQACSQASPGAIIALLGKGPEEYMIVGTQKHFFSERRIVQALK